MIDNDFFVIDATSDNENKIRKCLRKKQSIFYIWWVHTEKKSGIYVQNNSKYPSLCSINFLQFKLHLFFRQIDNFNFMLQNLTPNFGWKVKLANTANFKSWNNQFMRPKVNCWKYVHMSTYDTNMIILYLYFLSSSQYGWHILSGSLYFKCERFLIF